MTTRFCGLRRLAADRRANFATATALTMPVLLVCGEQDHDNGSATELKAALPDARLATIPGIVPDPYRIHSGCPFFARCRERMPGVCDQIVPIPVDLGGGRKSVRLAPGGITEG